jgi:hypothetical protein
MSNSACALRFTSVVAPRSTVFAGMPAAKILAAPPATDERRERSAISTRLGGLQSRARTGGRMQASGMSPSRRARPIERLLAPSERRHREACASSHARHIQTPTCVEIFRPDDCPPAPLPVSNPRRPTMIVPTRSESATMWSRLSEPPRTDPRWAFPRPTDRERSRIVRRSWFARGA